MRTERATAAPRFRSRKQLAATFVGLLVLAVMVPSLVLAGSARAGHGLLQAFTEPSDVGALINVDGVPRNTGSINNLELRTGDHEVCFDAVDGYVPPDCELVKILEGETTEVTGSYTPSGQLSVSVSPSTLRPTVSVDGTERDRAPVATDIAEGEHKVCFEELPGYEQVACRQVSVTAGSETSLDVTYVADGSGSDQERATVGLTALYDFNAGTGATVADVAGVHEGMELTVADTGAVTWTPDGLRFDEPTLAKTRTAPQAFYEAVEATEEFTVEAWVTAGNTDQNGPARIVSLGGDSSHSNLLLGQGEHEGASTKIEGRLHERSGDYKIHTDDSSLDSDLTHVVMTRGQDGVVAIYLDGELAAEEVMATDLDGWDTSFELGIGNELSGDRPWLGTFHLLALYDRALDKVAVQTNFAAGPTSAEDGSDVTDPEPTPSEPTPTPAPQPGTEGPVSKISQHDITWTLDGEYESGTYANGDHWVVGPVTVTHIDPPTEDLDGRVVNGSMINPSPRDGGELGYGHITDNRYAPDKNVAAGLSATDPLRIGVDSSLVSTISVEDVGTRPGIRTAAVLTVVDEAPRTGSFRPPYSGTDKTSRFNVDQLRTDRLPSLDPVAGTPDITEMASAFQRVWLDHGPDWAGRSIHPETSMPAYGRDLASRFGEGSLLLMLDIAPELKRPLLVNQVQIGIDLFGVVEDGGERNWVPNGGHAQGRKWPILFAGHLLDDPAMSGIGDRDDVYFGEDAQTFYVTQEDVDRGNGYTHTDIGLPEWGIRHDTDPNRDNFDWGASYRTCCTANSWGGHVLAAEIMGLREAWNHEALFDYTDRYVAQEESGFKRFWDHPFTEMMWVTYRDSY